MSDPADPYSQALADLAEATELLWLWYEESTGVLGDSICPVCKVGGAGLAPSEHKEDCKYAAWLRRYYDIYEE